MPTPRVRFNKWSRKLHRWFGLATLLPFGVVVFSGILLQLKKQSDWVQPPTAEGSGGPPALALADLLEIARDVPEAGIEGWEDIDRIDFRPRDGVAKVRSASRWEIQIDTATGEVLQLAYRRSDLIESIHDGSFFGDWAKLGVFLPSAVLVAILWATGIWLWWMPHGARLRKKRRADTRGRYHRP